MSCKIIYKIEFPNGKHYIGLTTTSLKRRQREHKICAKNENKKCLLYKALRKYNMVDSFELIEIDKADTLEELCEKEIEYILMYNSHYIDGYGYNMTYGGEGTSGYVFTEEDRKKNSERLKKYYENLEAIQKNSETVKKYYQENPEASQKMSKLLIKYYKENPEARKKQSERITKYFDNPKARKEQSEKKKKYYQNNPEAKKEQSEKMKKLFENQEAREKCSKAQKKRFENPEEIIKNSERLKKYYENPEAIQKNSEAVKKYYQENPDAINKILDAKGQNKPFDVFTVDGTFIKSFTYQYEAIEYLQKEYHITSYMKIGEVLRGNRNNSAGFVFKYK